MNRCSHESKSVPRVAGPRAGKSLIELLVVIITASAILSTAGQVLFRLSRTERSVRESGAIARAEMRLFRLFRADARRADAAEFGQVGEESQILFESANGTVIYRAANDAVSRHAVGDDGARQDVFRLGPTAIAFLVEDDRFAVLSVKPRVQTSGFVKAAAGDFQIVAALSAESSVAASHEQPGERSSPRAPVEASRPRSEPPVEATQPKTEASL